MRLNPPRKAPIVPLKAVNWECSVKKHIVLLVINVNPPAKSIDFKNPLIKLLISCKGLNIMDCTFVWASFFWKAEKESNVQASTFYTKICMLHWIDVTFSCCKMFLNEAKHIFHFGMGLGLQVWWIIGTNLSLLLLFILWCWKRIIMMHEQTIISKFHKIKKYKVTSIILCQFNPITKFSNMNWIISFYDRFIWFFVIVVNHKWSCFILEIFWVYCELWIIPTTAL